MSSPLFLRRSPPLNACPPVLPPTDRSRVTHRLTEAAARDGRLRLQVCADCGAVQYPPREVCGTCLSASLHWAVQPDGGEVLGMTTLHHSNHLYFRERLPWHIGLVRLDVGPTVIAFLTDSAAAAGCAVGQARRVRLSLRLDRAGQAVLVGQPHDEIVMQSNEKLNRETSCSPRGRRVLVSDGTTPAGQAITRALLNVGAETVWLGHAEPLEQRPDLAELVALPGVAPVPLDLRDGNAVDALAEQIGSKVDIVVSNAEVHRTQGIVSSHGVDIARAEMEINYFGLLRLAQAFGPALKSRPCDGDGHAVAWVNLLSVFALMNFPPQGTFSASKAAALSLAQCLRAEMLPHGIRVLNVFPGPLDDEWNHHLPAPKLTPTALAGAIVKGLITGVEDLYPGEVAQDWLERWQANPKALERELVRGAL